MRHKYILLVALLGILFVAYRIYNNFEVNSRFHFSSANVKIVYFLQANNIVKADGEIYNDLSKELITGKRKKIQEFSIRRQPVQSLVMILDKGMLEFIKGDENQIYVVSSKTHGTNKIFEYKSKYLLDLLDDLYSKYIDK